MPRKERKGRPRKASQDKVVRVQATMDRETLRIANEAAKKLGVSRSDIFRIGVRQTFGKDKEKKDEQ